MLLIATQSSTGCWITVPTSQIVESNRSTNSFTVSQLPTTVTDSWDRLSSSLTMHWRHQRLFRKEKIQKESDPHRMDLIKLPQFQTSIQVPLVIVILKANNNYRPGFQKSIQQRQIQISKNLRCQTSSAEKHQICNQTILISILKETSVWTESSKSPTQP